MAQNRNNGYQYGTAAYRMDVRREMERPYEEVETGRSLHKRAHYRSNINLLGIAFVIATFLFCAFVMVHYVKLQSTLTAKVKSVAAKQVELNKLQSMNDETYSRIISSVDLSAIESIAKGELGMNYAQEGQIITYSSVGNDYMRRVDN